MYNIEIGEQHLDYIKYENSGYFEPHRDWVRVTNSQHVQYTVLLGLTKNHYNHYNGRTILWIPVNNLNQYDYQILTETTVPNDLFKTVCQKYNLPDHINLIKELFEINKSNQKCIPIKINAYTIGNGLMFQSSFIHSGEQFTSNNNDNCKELFSFVINVTGIELLTRTTGLTRLTESTELTELTELTGLTELTESIELNKDYELDKYLIPEEKCSQIANWLSDSANKFILFDEFESWMCWSNSKFIQTHKLYPFEIIVSSGTYNKKTFSDKYIRFGNLDNDIVDMTNITNIANTSDTSDTQQINLLEKISQNLNQIYNLTKNKLNTKGRHSFINSVVQKIDEDNNKIANLDNMYFFIENMDSETISKIKCNLSNYLENFTYSNNSKVTRFEQILNTWETSGCNDSGDEYDETTYLTCQIDIKFGFFKLN
jgi:hypothetical protein